MADNKELLDFLQKYHASIGFGKMPNYAPQHDLKNLGVICIEEMYEDLTAEEYSEFVRKWVETFGLEPLDMLDAYKKFLQMNRCIIGAGKMDTIAQAAEASGYAAVPLETKALIDALFGRACLAAYWYAVRDVTVEGQTPAFINYHKLENLFKEALNAIEGIESKKGNKLRKEQEDE
ncbi:MAG: hypothetical protein IJV70_07260 [Clostridia bacterium]|nr:hypothetical protein [Clostridia bacterium]